MMTIIEKDGWIRWCGKDEITGEMPTKDFFTGSFLNIIKDTVVFVNDFQHIALFFVQGLNDANIVDATETELSYTGNHKLDRGTFKYILSGDNLTFYNISYRVGEKTVSIYEAKNLVPAAIEDVCKDFGGEGAHVSLYRACIQMRSFASKATTVASCAYSHWKRKFSDFEFKKLFPECSEKAEKICRDAYHGGLCYMSDKAYGGMVGHGIVLDVNSLYPWVMSNSIFAVGKENYGVGEIPDNIVNSELPYYVHFRARFNIKENHVPFLRTRCDKKHWGMEVLTTSMYFDNSDGKWYDAVSAPGEEWVDEWGEIHYDSKPMMVELCLYRDEFDLMLEQYDVTHIEYIDYVWWNGAKNIFSDYVSEFYEMKKNAKGKAERRISKTMQNGLSGRMSSKKKRSSVYLYKDISDKMKWMTSFEGMNTQRYQYGKYTNPELIGGISPFVDGFVETTSRSVSHIQIGAAITSIAMCYIVRKAQENYDHFLYTDTDSLHLDCDIEDVKGCEIGNELGQFKIEHRFLYAKYYKLKVYTMMETDENGTAIGSKVTWAGMPEDSHKILEAFLDEMYLRAVVSSGTERDDAIQKLYDRARPDGISDDDWNLCLNGWINKVGHDQMYKVSLPHIHKVVKSYKDFSFTNKTEWYQVDIMDSLDIRAKE